MAKETRQQAIDRKVAEQVEQFFPIIKTIIVKHYDRLLKFEPSTPEQDRKEGYDAILNFKGVHFPVRIREYDYHKQFHDFTIRSKVSSGLKTELAKLKEGGEGYYFYGYKTKDGTNLQYYYLLDINHFVSSGVIDNPTGKSIENPDGSQFNSYDLGHLDIHDIIIASGNLGHDKPATMGDVDAILEGFKNKKERDRKHAVEVYKESKKDDKKKIVTVNVTIN